MGVCEDGAAKNSERYLTFLFAASFLEYQIYSISKSMTRERLMFIMKNGCSYMSHERNLWWEKSPPLGVILFVNEQEVTVSLLNPLSDTNIIVFVSRNPLMDRFTMHFEDSLTSCPQIAVVQSKTCDSRQLPLFSLHHKKVFTHDGFLWCSGVWQDSVAWLTHNIWIWTKYVQ